MGQIYNVYGDLPQESQDLDLLLFQSLYTIVTGAYLSIIADLQGDDARYTYAIIAMWQHHAMGASSRRLNALNDMMDLQFTGDAGKWKLELMAKAREVYASDLTIEHFIMHCAFKSFEGKNTQVQAMMAEDINSNDGSEAFALEKLATKYSQFVATLTSAKTNKINAVNNDITCTYCRIKGHKAAECRTRLRDEQTGEKKKECTYCKGVGHDASRCFKKENDDQKKKKKKAGAPPTTPSPGTTLNAALSQPTHAALSPGTTVNAATVNAALSQPLTSNQIESLCSQIRSGDIKLAFNVNVADDASSRKQRPLHSEAPVVLAGETQCPLTPNLINTRTSLTPTPIAGLLRTRKQRPLRPEAPVVLAGETQCPLTPNLINARTSLTSPTLCPTTLPAIAAVLGPECSSTLHPLSATVIRVGDHCEPPTVSGTAKCEGWESETHMVNMAKADQHVKPTILSLCDGMGGTGLTFKALGMRDLYHIIGIEKSTDSRRVAKNADPEIEHGIRGVHDIYDLTEEDIANRPKDSIVCLSAAPECVDFTKLRLLPDRPGYKGPPNPKGHDPRKGLDGKHSRTFRRVIVIWGWVKKHHPNAKFFIENVEFEDMPEHWAEVCQALGKPYIVDHQDFSTTKRRRAYWTNIELPPDWQEGCGPIDPNSCLDEGRKVQKYLANGRYCTRPLGAKWRNVDDNIIADTGRPLLITDVAFDDPQHVRPHEAEKLHGMASGTTHGAGITDELRLKCVGAGWDINVTKMFFKHLQPKSGEVTNSVMALAEVFMTHLENNGATLDQLERGRNYALIKRECIEAFTSMINQALQQSVAEAAKIIALERHHSLVVNAAIKEPTTILDSGAAVHIDARTRVTDPDNRTRLTSFTGEASWTQGSGYLPLEFYDESTGTHFDIDIEDAHSVPGVGVSLLSMAKLIRSGWVFSLSLDSLHAFTPTGQKVRVTMGLDDVLRLPHNLREGDSGQRIPINVVRQTKEGVSADFLHRLFNHGSAEKVHHTLGQTTGIQQPPKCSKGCFCKACAQGNARKPGLKQTAYTCLTHPVLMVTATDGYASDDSMLSLLSGSDSDDDYWDRSAESEGDDECVIANALEAEGSDDSDLEVDEGVSVDIPEFKATTPGRTATATPPRFDAAALKPFEVMFADEKPYDTLQRGGHKTSFVLIDVASSAWFKVDEVSKTQHGRSFAEIMITNGAHLLPYPRTLYTDGCGSMHIVRKVAVAMGFNHIFTPPHDASLNLAESICDRAWAIGRVHLNGTGASEDHMALAVSHGIYMHNRMATTVRRGFKTPYEIIRGTIPDISHCMPFFTKTFVHVPKSKRAQLKQQGLGHVRAEAGRLVGYQDMWGTTHKVLLDNNRMVHSRNCTFDIYDVGTGERLPEATEVSLENHHRDHLMDLLGHNKTTPLGQTTPTKHRNPLVVTSQGIPTRRGDGSDNDADVGFGSEGDMSNPDPIDPEGDTSVFIDGLLFPEAHVDIEPLDMSTPPTGRGHTQRRPTQHYVPHTAWTDEPRNVFLATMDLISRFDEQCYIFEKHLERAVKKLRDTSAHEDTGALIIAAAELAHQAEKDMNWNDALESDHRGPSLEALDAELKSLTKTILTPIHPGDPEYAKAVKQATPGRLLLDIKRSGKYKVRGVKQGFRENKEQADGYEFNYYSNVIKLNAVRLALLRKRKKGSVIGIKDVSTAFLQAHPYPNGMVKYIAFKHPVTKEWMYFRQSGPIYGEASAPVRWEDTVAPWLEAQGFARGDNEKSAFYHPTRDLLVLLYVDDVLGDGQREDVEWIFRALEERFECRDADWLTEGATVDYLGMDAILRDGIIYLSMEKYIDKCCKILDITEKGWSTPIDRAIDTDSPLLDGAKIKEFLIANGMLGWLAQTTRLDVAYAYSRIAQHSATPTVAALKAVRKVFAYLKTTKKLCIAQQVYGSEPNVIEFMAKPTSSVLNAFRFYSDSDHAGNSEAQNKRKSQNGAISTIDGAPWWWISKSTSVCFASPDIGEAHADTSSAAAEIFAAGNATQDIMGIKYMVEEMGMDFPTPFILEMDNEAARIFCSGNAQKTKLKHIDCRQHWVRILRDKGIMKPAHVPTSENLADLFTKILPPVTFLRLRDLLMKPYCK